MQLYAEFHLMACCKVKKHACRYVALLRLVASIPMTKQRSRANAALCRVSSSSMLPLPHYSGGGTVASTHMQLYNKKGYSTLSSLPRPIIISGPAYYRHDSYPYIKNALVVLMHSHKTLPRLSNQASGLARLCITTWNKTRIKPALTISLYLGLR